jgi:hypothetical protein
MIYDEPGEIVRRYGKTGWKVIARKQDGSPNQLLISFFERQYGYWQTWDEAVSGCNELFWETKSDTGSDIVHFENEYTGCKAKILRSTLLEVISTLHAWKAGSVV